MFKWGIDKQILKCYTCNMANKTISEYVKNFIERDGCQNTELTYFPPNYVRELLLDKNIEVNKMYIVRMYAELGIVWDDKRRCWTKKL